MSAENTKYDIRAVGLYNLHRRDRGINEGWKNWHHLTRKERDYWRGLAEISIHEDLWPEPEGDF